MTFFNSLRISKEKKKKQQQQQWSVACKQTRMFGFAFTFEGAGYNELSGVRKYGHNFFINNYAFVWCHYYIVNLKKGASTDPSKEKSWKMHKTIEYHQKLLVPSKFNPYTFGVTLALDLAKK